MTIETQAFVSPQDIVGLRFQCKCGAKISLPISDKFKMALVNAQKCPNCHDHWFQGDRDNIFTTITNLVSYLDALKSATTTPTFDVAFELSNASAIASREAV
jgi:hypothetical protein